jgi:7,8-dihydropterin-6-yl-methyl-4-(beta-D-ribofuranosyl)aminobenzene 5'-phosphate synthase
VCACDGVAFRHEPFCEMAKAEIPNKLLRSYTGTRFVFSS